MEGIRNTHHLESNLKHRFLYNRAQANSQHHRHRNRLKKELYQPRICKRRYRQRSHRGKVLCGTCHKWAFRWRDILSFKTKAVNILVSGVHADYLLSDCVDVNCQELPERASCLCLDSLGVHGKLWPLLQGGRKSPVPRTGEFGRNRETAGHSRSVVQTTQSGLLRSSADYSVSPLGLVRHLFTLKDTEFRILLLSKI